MGGKHLDEHANCLTATGTGQFMELISVDHDAPEPDRIRWFSLDEDRTIERRLTPSRPLLGG